MGLISERDSNKKIRLLLCFHCEGGGIGDQKKLAKKASLKSEGCYVAAIRMNIGNLLGINKDIWATFQP